MFGKKKGQAAKTHLKVLIILPEECVDEDPEDENISPTFYSNCEFNDKMPNGRLKCTAVPINGDTVDNYIMLGNTKYQLTTGFALCQLAIDGTQQTIEEEAETAPTSDTDYLANLDKIMKAAKKS
jgi:hypothetical protein